MRPRPRRRIEFERIMLKQAWCAKELASKLGLGITSCRRYLRRYYDFGLLERQKFGVQMFYAVSRFLEPPDEVLPCPTCGRSSELYRRQCGCSFQLCSQDNEHNVFSYCERHIAQSRSDITDRQEEVKQRERGNE